MIRVVIADDQSLIRQAVRAILEADPRITVCAEAANGKEALLRVRESLPDVVVMDIRMPELDGIGATAQLCADPDLAGTRVLVLTTFEEDENVYAALRAGASGFIGKGAEPHELVAAVHGVYEGEALLSPVAVQALIRRVREPQAPLSATQIAPEVAAQLHALTEREREVLELVGQGLSNAEIAERWVISPHTAKTHVNRIMAKLHAHDRAQLVIIAYETGIIAPGRENR